MCCPGGVSGIPDTSPAMVGKPVIGGAVALVSETSALRPNVLFPTEIDR
jgi:hypothetical protein